MSVTLVLYQIFVLLGAIKQYISQSAYVILTFHIQPFYYSGPKISHVQLICWKGHKTHEVIHAMC